MFQRITFETMGALISGEEISQTIFRGITMKMNGTLTKQIKVSTEVQVGNAYLPMSREQLIELVDAELAAIGGGGDTPEI